MKIVSSVSQSCTTQYVQDDVHDQQLLMQALLLRSELMYRKYHIHVSFALQCLILLLSSVLYPIYSETTTGYGVLLCKLIFGNEGIIDMS